MLGNIIKMWTGYRRFVQTYITSGVQRCVPNCVMDQSEWREEKSDHPHEKNHWKRPKDVPTWRRSKGLEPGAEVSCCHMHFLEFHRPIESFLCSAKRCGKFWMSLKPTHISKLTLCLPSIFIRDNPLTNSWKQEKVQCTTFNFSMGKLDQEVNLWKSWDLLTLHPVVEFLAIITARLDFLGLPESWDFYSMKTACLNCAFLVKERSGRKRIFRQSISSWKINTTGRPLAPYEVPSIINHAETCWKQKVLQSYSFSLGNKEPLTSFMEWTIWNNRIHHPKGGTTQVLWGSWAELCQQSALLGVAG